MSVWYMHMHCALMEVREQQVSKSITSPDRVSHRNYTDIQQTP